MPSDWDPAQDADKDVEPVYIYERGSVPWVQYALAAALFVSLCAACGWWILLGAS